MSWLEAGHPEEAIAQFEKALRLDPALDAAGMNRRLAMAYQGRYGDALADVPPARLVEALNNVGRVAMRRGDYAQAETLLKRAMAASPTLNEAIANNLRDLEALEARPRAASSCRDGGGCDVRDDRPDLVRGGIAGGEVSATNSDGPDQ